MPWLRGQLGRYGLVYYFLDLRDASATSAFSPEHIHFASNLAPSAYRLYRIGPRMRNAHHVGRFDTYLRQRQLRRSDDLDDDPVRGYRLPNGIYDERARSKYLDDTLRPGRCPNVLSIVSV